MPGKGEKAGSVRETGLIIKYSAALGNVGTQDKTPSDGPARRMLDDRMKAAVTGKIERPWSHRKKINRNGFLSEESEENTNQKI